MKRTRRSLAKIRSLRSVAWPPEASRAASRERLGIAAGSSLARGRDRLQRPVLEDDVVEVGAPPAPRGRAGILGPVALQDECRIRVGEGEELEVIVGLGSLLKAVEHLIRGSGRSTRCRTKAGTQRRVTAEIAPSAPTPTRAARRSSDRRPRPAPGRCHRRGPARSPHLGGDVAQLRPGAVGGGRDRAGDRLPIDVAEVLHRQSEPMQLLVELGEHRAGADPDQARLAVGIDDAAQRRRRRSSSPSLIAASVKEWPLPATLIVSARPPAATRLPGRARRGRGAGYLGRPQTWSPAQLRHSPAMIGAVWTMLLAAYSRPRAPSAGRPASRIGGWWRAAERRSQDARGRVAGRRCDPAPGDSTEYLPRAQAMFERPAEKPWCKRLDSAASDSIVSAGAKQMPPPSEARSKPAEDDADHLGNADHRHRRGGDR